MNEALETKLHEALEDQFHDPQELANTVSRIMNVIGDPIDFQIHQEKTIRTFSFLPPEGISAKVGDELHCVIGMTTEVAELMDAYKKSIYYRRKLDEVNVAEELGDLMWYVACYCKLMNWDLKAILETNIAKLQARYPEKFTSEQAFNRDLQTERKILNDGMGKHNQ